MTNAVNIAQIGSNNTTFRNKIINGACVIDQRNAGASVPVTNATLTYAVDRTLVYEDTSASSCTAQRVTDAPAGFINSLKFTVGTGGSATAAQLAVIDQAIEGFNFADFSFGTASAQTATLSFWVKASITGTYCVAFRNASDARSYVAQYTVSAANTWEQKTITIAGDTTGTWATDNGRGITVRWDLGSGSTSQTATIGSWQTGLKYSTSSQANVIGTSGATFAITGVQLEAGSAASPFEYRSYGTELALCQRYCQVITGVNYPLCTGLSYTTVSSNGVIALPVTMRTAPTPTYAGATDFVVTNGGGTGLACTVVANFVYSPNTLEFTGTVASGLTVGQASLIRTGSGGTAKITLSAEL